MRLKLPAKTELKAKTVTIKLTARQAKTIKEFGGGNITKGITSLIDQNRRSIEYLLKKEGGEFDGNDGERTGDDESETLRRPCESAG